jgi:hypothetical protein
LFFLCSSKERTKERAPKITTAAYLGARDTRPCWRNQIHCSSHYFRDCSRADI